MACKKSLLYFASKFCYIIDRDKKKRVKWQDWGYLLDTLEVFLSHKEIVIPKARQLGITWLVCIYIDWLVLFHDAAKVLIMSKGEPEAFAMIAKCRFIYDNLPDFLKPNEKHPDNQGIIDFYDSNSEIRALASTKGAGRSTDASLVVRDELADHPYGETNFAAIGPTIDAGSAQMIDLGTLSFEDVNNHLTKRVIDARDGVSNAHLHDLANWRLRPTRDDYLSLDEWFEKQIIPKYPAYQREKEYPESLAQALAPPKTICRFDLDALNDLEKRCTSPIREERNGLVKIYQEPIVTGKYSMVMDSSEGSALSDPCAGGVFDRWKTRVVSIHGKITLEEQALILFDLYERYNEPYTAVERNSCGLTLITKLKDLGIAKWFYHDRAKTKEGFWTGTNRSDMIADLADAIFTRDINEPEIDVINEFRSFIRTDKYPAGEARGGAHDDFTMMWAIELQIRKSMPTSGKVGIKSFQYSESW
ncbi:hypothetical protein LCGC14_0880480 [marine sediment metagenome]|uniref:Terminase large subunit gp17-like C-terminal domain-containing protein n=1 Tax=marine sediment metagenome TaxID=412755 RepID=A0A0F9RLL3_9ZZZZ